MKIILHQTRGNNINIQLYVCLFFLLLTYNLLVHKMGNKLSGGETERLIISLESTTELNN